MNTTIIEAETPESEWDMIIQPKAHLFDLNLREVWNYRDLLLLFVKRDFIAQYKQTILGPLWYLIQPIFTTIMFLVVFGKIANIPTDGVNPILFYMAGITIWTYFSSCLNNTSSTFVANAGIFGKVYFPRLIIPLSNVFSNIIKFGIQFLLLLVMMVFYSFKGFPIHFGIAWLGIPVLLMMMAGLGLGLGIIISSVTTKYRDLTVLISFGVQLLMYVTPIFYSLSFVKNKSYGKIIEWNPLTPIVECWKYALFGKGSFDTTGMLYSSAVIIIILFVGLLIFSKVEKTFMDTV